jgi:hypothetical protein
MGCITNCKWTLWTTWPQTLTFNGLCEQFGKHTILMNFVNFLDTHINYLIHGLLFTYDVVVVHQLTQTTLNDIICLKEHYIDFQCTTSNILCTSMCILMTYSESNIRI